MSTPGFQFDHSYSKLPSPFFSKVNPEPVKEPKLVLFNEILAKQIGLDFSDFNSKQKTDLFSGNVLPKESEPIAQAYAGHQFGHFTMLGDGRAVLLGEHLTADGKRFDIQFKGSGRTPYSRRGDGRAALGPMLREYIISEAMAGLGIPTTRSLAVVTTGEPVYRERPLPGAILTRVASSHIRVGTFEFAASQKDASLLPELINYTINRHYPKLKGHPESAIQLLKAVIQKQAELIGHWMRVGFIHGVMNTDNMTLAAETIDYGPCAFMDEYNPKTVFSSIDHQGRYAYTNQPIIAQWNLARLAETLLPVIEVQTENGFEKTKEAIFEFTKIYQQKWLKMMRSKLGLFEEKEEHQKLIKELLNWMQKNQADYTNIFLDLMEDELPQKKNYKSDDFQAWYQKWQAQTFQNSKLKEESKETMRKTNPQVIPRNHKVEEALVAAENFDFAPLHSLLKVLQKPYQPNSKHSAYQKPPKPDEIVQATFCGT